MTAKSHTNSLPSRLFVLWLYTNMTMVVLWQTREKPCTTLMGWHGLEMELLTALQMDAMKWISLVIDWHARCNSVDIFAISSFHMNFGWFDWSIHMLELVWMFVDCVLQLPNWVCHHPRHGRIWMGARPTAVSTSEWEVPLSPMLTDGGLSTSKWTLSLLLWKVAPFQRLIWHNPWLWFPSEWTTTHTTT